MKPSIFDTPGILPGKTLHQPFAGAVLLAGLGYRAKRAETRTSRTTYRGPFVVLAAAAPNAEAEFHRERMRGYLVEQGVPGEVFDEVTTIFGKALAVATITGCRPLLLSDYPQALFFEEGRHLWSLDDIWPIEPFHFSGRQGWSAVPVARVCAAVESWIERALPTGRAATTEACRLAVGAWQGQSVSALQPSPAQTSLFRSP